MHIQKLVCGRRHCMAVFEQCAFYIWGDNESGQLGNRKRSFVESPVPKRKFEIHHNVENIAAGVDSAAVIVEALPPRKKKQRKQKRSMTMQEAMRINDDQIKADNEQRMWNQQRKEKAAEEDMKKRRPLSERFKSKVMGDEAPKEDFTSSGKK